MGLITDVSTFLRAPKQLANKINEDQKAAKKKFFLGMLILSAAYGALFPVLKMGVREETLAFVARDALAFPAIFMITYFVLLFPLNLVLPQSEKVSALLALWLNGILLTTLTFIPLLILSTLKNKFVNVVVLNGILVTAATLFCALQIYSCLSETHPNNRAMRAVTLSFALLILWTLLNAQHLFTLSAGFVVKPMIGGALESAAGQAIVAPKVM